LVYLREFGDGFIFLKEWEMSIMTPEYASQIVFEQDIKKQDKMIENLKEADSKQLLKMCMKLIRGEDF